MSAPLNAWVISDGRRGIENQVLGLGEAMSAQRALSLETQIIKNGWLFGKLPAWTQFSIRKNPNAYISKDNYPDIAIGCGRQAIAPLLALKRHLKDNVFTIYIQHPRLDPSYFDYIVAPQHDQLTGSNVISIIGSPNRITPNRLAQDKNLISPKSKKVAAWLVGGSSKTHSFSALSHEQHLSLLKELLSDGWQVLVTTSRRTPQNVVNDYCKLAEASEQVDIYTGEGENPYFAYLHHAEMIFVTEDSTNMLTEACTVGKSVFRLPMSGNPGKFQQLYDALKTRCRVRSAIGSDLAPQGYTRLRETDRAAEKLWMAFDKISTPLA